jgi:hypothetical protein
MSYCHCKRHKDILSEYSFRDDKYYQEHEQNIIFITFEKVLIIIDSTNYVRYCPRCKVYRGIYIYGTWPNICASFDGVTNLPVRALVNKIDISVFAALFNELSFGKFIYTSSLYQHYANYAIIYYPTGKIEQTKFKRFQNISVDGKPAICCKSLESGRFMLINSDGEIINVEIVYSTDINGTIYKIGNGMLKSVYELDKMYWTYTANPALKTKPAIHE